MNLSDSVYLDETYDEGFVDERDSGYDEAIDDEAEFLPFLPGIPGLIGAGGQTVGSAISNIGRSISGLFNYRPNAPIRPARPSAPTGVSTATLATPQGQATLRLPSPLVTRDEFQRVIGPMQASIERVAQRANTLDQDVGKLSRRVGTVLADTRKEVEQAKLHTAREIGRMRKDTVARIEKLRRAQNERLNMIMMMTLMLGDGSGSSGDDMLMFLPLMMMSGDQGGGSDNNTMMMLAMVMLMKK